ncbi:MAG: DUF1996 domain-containing protein [Granulosicoccus sp.]
MSQQPTAPEESPAPEVAPSTEEVSESVDVMLPVSQQPTVPEESSVPEAARSTEEVSESIDVMLPIVNLTTEFSVTPESNTSDHHAKFEFSAPDANGYLCRLGNQDFAACDSSVFLVDVGLGQHTFDVQALRDSSYGDVVSVTWFVESLFEDNNTELISTNVVPDRAEPNSWRGIIRINCDFAHSSYNDPIVFPNQENAAHLHRFYGNTLVDHTTTLESLYTTGDSSCQGNTLNRSAYWIPALLAPQYDAVTGERVIDEQGEPAWHAVPAVVGNDDVAHEVFYYSAGVDNLNDILPAPAGLRIIAGNHMTMPGSEQDVSIARWHCQSWESDDANNPQFSADIPQCIAPDRLRMDLFFPSCWNGVDLDSPDHKSHLTYPVKDDSTKETSCPDSHPVAIVRPSYHYAFGVKPEFYDPQTRSSKGWRLASDMYEVNGTVAGGLSLHGDWFNGWHPEIMQTLLTGCIQNGLDCHDGNLSIGYRISGTRPGNQLVPAVVNQGLGF